jgi:hypothetical protein
VPDGASLPRTIRWWRGVGGHPERVQRHPHVAALHDLERHVGLDQPLDLARAQRRRAAVDVADDVRVRLQDHV